ncbi:hypothetical protein M9H77_22380 [Catharanthus roseus]|uniref:Uncharacterized protein n=1 Tax=Catharanthus roseus TaxID=4058 RepID=A0ACC0APY7_CATRO|nr:hypothetical protein M9H77_22380 [Catharanthus roseus]
MEDKFHHVQRIQQALEGLMQQLSCISKIVGDLKREEEAILEQSSRRNHGGLSMHNNQWIYGNFSLYARSYKQNSYDVYEGNRLGTRNGYNDKSYKKVLRNKVTNGGNYVNMDGRFHKRTRDVERYYDSHEHYEHSYGSKNMYNEHNDSYNYGGCNSTRSSQTLGTTSIPLSYNNLKLSFCVELFVLMIIKYGSKMWNHYSIPMT